MLCRVLVAFIGSAGFVHASAQSSDASLRLKRGTPTFSVQTSLSLPVGRLMCSVFIAEEVSALPRRALTGLGAPHSTPHSSTAV